MGCVLPEIPISSDCTSTFGLGSVWASGDEFSVKQGWTGCEKSWPSFEGRSMTHFIGNGEMGAIRFSWGFIGPMQRFRGFGI